MVSFQCEGTHGSVCPARSAAEGSAGAARPPQRAAQRKTNTLPVLLLFLAVEKENTATLGLQRIRDPCGIEVGCVFSVHPFLLAA